jgi:hypothetical protein
MGLGVSLVQVWLKGIMTTCLCRKVTARHSIDENTPKDEDDKNVTVDTQIDEDSTYLQRMCEQHSQALPTLAGPKGDNKSRSAPA